MARKRRGIRWHWKVAIGVLAAVCVVSVAVSGWLFYTQLARSVRESQSAEQIAAGKGRWVRVSDVDLYIQEWGHQSAPTVLLSHGTGAWSGTWFQLPEVLSAAGWRVVAFDLPPFGLSKTAGSSVDYTRPAQARRIIELIDSLGVPVTLVGHSFGSGPALEAAMAGGARIQKLVLVDPALGLGSNGEAPVCEASGNSGGLLAHRGTRTALVSGTATWPVLTGTMLKQFVHRKEVVNDDLVPAYQIPFRRQRFSEGLGDWAAAFARANCELAMSLDPVKVAAWSASGPPVALIWGAEDGITPLAQGRALNRWIQHSSLTVLPGVGHIPHIESPDAFSKALQSALGPR